MKKFHGIVAALAMAASAVSANALPALYATFFGAGSSAQYNTFALAGENASGLCGTHTWTQKKGANLIDPRSTSIAAENGNIWIEWNDAAAAGTAGSGIVCYYVSVDSVVGQRAYFASDTVTITVPAGTASDGSVPLLGGTATALPANILTYVNGSKINFAATDIRPEDAKFASMRALTAYGSFMTGRGFTGVGYQGAAGTPWLGVPIVSSVSTASANPVDYAFYAGDHDPITGAATRTFIDIRVGAAPVVVFVNASNTSGGHMGDPALAISDISKQMLNNVVLGNVGHVRDLSSNGTGAADAALHTWVREPISGTYNTMDFNIPNADDIQGDYGQGAGRVTGQEANINTTNTACAGVQTTSGCPAESGNPLWHVVNANGSSRGRVIGTGQMVSTVALVPDSIGYAFWGYSTFNAQPSLKYLTVNGSDPLQAAYTTGALPQCPSAPCVLAFTNIKNGGYPIWSIYRAVYDPTDSTNLATNMVGYAQTASTTVYSDFVPASAMNVFRSHFAQVVTTAGVGEGPNNGYVTGIPETGGDMGGQVLTVQSELDFIADTGGSQQVNLKQ